MGVTVVFKGGGWHHYPDATNYKVWDPEPGDESGDATDPGGIILYDDDDEELEYFMGDWTMGVGFTEFVGEPPVGPQTGRPDE